MRYVFQENGQYFTNPARGMQIFPAQLYLAGAVAIKV